MTTNEMLNILKQDYNIAYDSYSFRGALTAQSWSDDVLAKWCPSHGIQEGRCSVPYNCSQPRSFSIKAGGAPLPECNARGKGCDGTTSSRAPALSLRPAPLLQVLRGSALSSRAVLI